MKNRLSFTNRVPEVPKSEKKEVNPTYILALALIFILALGVKLFNDTRPNQENRGLATNSDRLKPSEEPSKGLRESEEVNTENVGLDEVEQDTEEASVTENDTGNTDGNTEKTDEIDGEANEPVEEPFPTVLLDVEAESIDYASDQTHVELTRKGYQALGKDPDLAIRYFELALKKDRYYSDANFGLGQAYKARGEEDLAVVHMCKGAVRDVEYRLNTVIQMGRDCP